MKDKGYAIFGFAILAIALLYTIYTVFVIYDIRMDTKTIIYYLMAFCFVTSVGYQFYKEKRNKVKHTKTKIEPNTIDKDKDKDKNPYPDWLFN